MHDYLKKINENNKRFYLLQDELTQLYPKYKISPDDYEEQWSRISGNFNELNKDLFLLQNSIEKDSDDVERNMKKTNKLIVDLEKKNKMLKQKLNYLQTSDNAAEGLIDETQEIFDENLYYLLVLIGSTFGLGYMVFNKIK